MKVLAHLDPFVLEQELLDRIAAAKGDSALTAVLVVVPTARLAAHVRVRIGERLDACLAVEVVHHRGLAMRILDGDPSSRLRVASKSLLLGLLERALEGIPANLLARFARERPGFVGALLGTLRDLRDAGIEPAELSRAAHGEGEGALGEVYAAYTAALDGARAFGLVDDAGLARAALPEASRFAARFSSILHHGAYELVGSHLDLVRALDRERPVTFLLPAQPGGPASAFSERFASRHLLARGETIEALPGRAGGLLGERIAGLYDEASEPPGELPAGSVSLRHAQGARSEIAEASRWALAAVAAGTPPGEIAIVARSLAPYALAIAESLDDDGLAYTSSLASPLRREPEVRDLLALLRAAANDFPRGATAELLASPRIRWSAFGLESPPPGDLAEAWSREAAIVGGVEDWSRTLVEWAGRPRAHDDATEGERAEAEVRARARAALATRIGAAVEAIAARTRPSAAASWSAHARAVLELADEAVGPSAEEGGESPLELLRGLIEDLSAQETILGDRREVPFPEMVSWLERAVDGATVTARRADAGGFRVLDAMQARGLTFRRVFLVGMNASEFPRVAREDPLLSDATRERLREATSRPVPVKREGADEERLLLALVLGSAGEGLDVSWQRADDSGRTRSSSIALREVGRAVLGRPDVEAVHDRVSAIPAHPRDRLERLARETGLLSPSEEALLLALRGSGRAAAAENLALRDDGRLKDGLLMLRSTESFEPAMSAFDGRVGDTAGPVERVSVSALERLGRCPLQYFFRDVLRVVALEEPASSFEVAARDLGQRIHALLESTYSALGDEREFEHGEADLVRRASEILASRWEAAVADLGPRFDARVPVLWRVERERWQAALVAFLNEDLARLASGGYRPRAFEETRGERLDFGEDVSIRVEGRLDRTFERDGEVLVGDYKTSGDLAARGNVTGMLRGVALQVPLYARLAGGARVELLGVGPTFAPERRPRGAESRVVFDGFETSHLEEGFAETVRVLLRLARGGRFPLRAGRHCSWCPYAAACRRNHPPTVHREERAPDTADFRDLSAKTRRDGPTLGEVRAGRRPEGAEDET